MRSATSPSANPKGEPGPAHTADLRIPSQPAEAKRVQEEIEILLKASQYGEHDIFAIKLAVEEALVNAIKHGNQLDQRKKVQITYRILPERFEIHITDEGTGFDPCDVPDPTTPEYLERPCGRGLMLMRHYMNEVAYNERGNSVRMCKQRRGAK